MVISSEFNYDRPRAALGIGVVKDNFIEALISGVYSIRMEYFIMLNIFILAKK